MKAIFLTALCLLYVPSFAQQILSTENSSVEDYYESLEYRLWQYTEQKRDPFLAGLSSGVMTGLGQIYNKEYVLGMGLFLANTAAIAGIIHTRQNDRDNYHDAYWLAPFAIAVYSITDAIDSASDHNKGLKTQYRLSLNGFHVQFALNF